MVDSQVMWTLSLSFRIAASEVAFVAWNSEKVISALYRTCVTFGGVVVISLTFKAASEAKSGGFRLDNHWFNAFIIIPILCLLSVSTQSRCRTWIPQYIWEYMAACLVIFAIATLPLQRRSNYKLIHDFQQSGSPVGRADEAAAILGETTIMLSLYAYVAASHLLLPIRWKVLSCVELAALAQCYLAAFPYAVYSQEFFVIRLSNYAIFTALVILASFGKRAMEYHERSFFMGLIQEKQLRAQAEFKLERATAEQPAEQSHTASSLTTASTARIFDRLEDAATEITDEDDTAKQVLVEVANLGHKEQWIIADDEVEPVPYVLGRGAYGVVASGRYHGAAVAVKLAIQTRTRLGILRAMSTELRILRHLAHPNIVRFYGAIIHLDHNEVGLVLEHVTGSSLDKLTGQESFGPEHRQKVLVDICNGLRYLHSRSPAVVHGDLKPANVLVQTPIADPLAKLSDFGLARYATVRSRGLGGSIRYMPPEGLSDCMPTSRADVFSFGRLLFAVLVGIEPLIEYSAKDIQKALERGEVMPLTWPPHIVARDKELCDNCLRIVPPERLDILAIHQGLLGGNVQPTLICRLTSL